MRVVEALKEINGKALADIHDPKDPTKVIKKKGDQLDGFGQLMDDGSTMGGNWLHSGVYTEAGNNALALIFGTNRLSASTKVCAADMP